MQDRIVAYRQRQKDRRNSYILLTIIWTVFVIIGGVISYYVQILTNVFFAIAYIGFFITWFTFTRAYPPEKYEIAIGVDFFDAMSLIKMSVEERGRAARRHRKMAVKHVSRAMFNVNRLSRLGGRSEVMEKEMSGRLKSFSENVQKFVLPRIVFGEELDKLESTLNGFSKFFVDQWESTGMKQLDDINLNIQNLGKPPKELTPFLFSLRGLSRSKPIVLTLSLGLGFGLTFLIILGFLTVDAVGWIRSNIGVFILAGIGMSGLVSAIFIRTT